LEAGPVWGNARILRQFFQQALEHRLQVATIKGLLSGWFLFAAAQSRRVGSLN
jgi:hypothetical protein